MLMHFMESPTREKVKAPTTTASAPYDPRISQMEDMKGKKGFTLSIWNTNLNPREFVAARWETHNGILTYLSLTQLSGVATSLVKKL
ncbi:hypothetical protein CEXT_429431 [Caerostris extrusa]|uniref:Uncharacterized protein n=1 Tax=Caerostris extrusa TaxID=172846 RepID=A0AAV4SYV2_CAEEX|nr:hypothetical protein CEXT_429431 [Caerostris extrusa]